MELDLQSVPVPTNNLENKAPRRAHERTRIKPALRATVLLAGIGAMAIASAAYGARLIVDDDRLQCPDAKFTTIQEAVDAASNGDTILVCAGTYDETTRVNKTVKLLGAQHGRDGRSRTVNPATESLIIAGDVFFLLEADNVVFDGFSLQVVLSDGEGVGLRTSNDFSGYKIINSVLDADGTTAVWLGSSGVKGSLIRRNLFKGRLGIAAENDEGSIARNVLVKDNLFDGASMAFIGAEHSDLVITKNKLIHGGAISIFDNVFGSSPPPRTRNVQVIKNKVLNPGGTAAISLRRIDGGLIKDNLLRSGTESGITATGENAALRLTGNRIAGFAAQGIEIGSPVSGNLPQEITTGLTVDLNEIEDNVFGISLLFSQANTFSENKVADNASIGIDVDQGSFDNLISNNEVRGSGQLDCQDASSGSGTSGTSNSWTDNEGSTSSPPGLCADAP
jgi:parallel beta-helix repeat protein